MGKGNRGKRSLRNAQTWDHGKQEERKERKLKKAKRNFSKNNDSNKNETINSTFSDEIPLNIDDDIPLKIKRGMILAHDTIEKKESYRLRLHIENTKRLVEKLHGRLVSWDEKEESQRRLEEQILQENKLKEEKEKEQGIKKPKQHGPRPETWNLRGAARPACEVYDFDTRYVCPYEKEIEDHKVKQNSIQNILSVYRGNIHNGPKPFCQNYVMLLAQLGHLYIEAKKYRKARETFLECIELEGNDMKPSITNARNRLIRMYMEIERYESAKRLCQTLTQETSAWMHYSALLLEFTSNETQNQATKESLLEKAIKVNVYCAFFISFHSTFSSVMEYTMDIEDAEDGTLLEAIEYFSSDQMQIWISLNASDWMKQSLLRIYKGEILSKDLLEWGNKLIENEKIHLIGKEQADEESYDDDDDEVDFSMYAGMFRTAMEMLEEAGEFK